MKQETAATNPEASTELLILPDGRILVHNLTPVMAALLAELNPADEPMRERASGRSSSFSQPRPEFRAEQAETWTPTVPP